MTSIAKLSLEYTLRFSTLAALLPMAQLVRIGNYSDESVKVENRTVKIPSEPKLTGMFERDLNAKVLASALMIASQMDKETYLGRIKALTSDIPNTAKVEGTYSDVTASVLTLTLIALSLANVFIRTLGGTNNTFTGPYATFSPNLEGLLNEYYLFCNRQTAEGMDDVIVNTVEFVKTKLERFEYLATTVCTNLDFTQVTVVNETTSTGGRSSSGSGRHNFKGFNSPFLAIQIAELASRIIRNSREFLELFKGVVRGHLFSLEDSLVDYDSTLRGKYEGLFKDDHSYARPNKRYMFTGVIMPSMISNNVKMIFAVDHSGSITDADSAHQLGVIDSVLSKHPNHTSSLMAFDTALHGEVVLGTGERLLDALDRLGNTVGSKGGTDFSAVFHAIAEREDLADIDMITIISADGCGGDLNLSSKFRNTFKGKILFVFHNDKVGISSAESYRKQLGSDFQFEVLLYNRA